MVDGLKQKSNLRMFFLTVLLALASGVVVSGLLTRSISIPSSGVIKAINVDVYWDVGCTQNVTGIDWGTPAPGDVVNNVVYIKNGGTSLVTLSMLSSGWDPAGAGSFLSLTWDREGATVDAGGVVQASLSLDVSGAITGITDFSFDIVIEGTG